MSTTTAEVREEHLSKEEVEALAHPKQPLRRRVGVVLSYVGMALIVLYGPVFTRRRPRVT